MTTDKSTPWKHEVFILAPTGAGKTQMAKEIAEQSGWEPVRLDIADYAARDVSKFMGHPPGYVPQEGPALPFRDNARSIVEKTEKEGPCSTIRNYLREVHGTRPTPRNPAPKS